MAQTATTSKPTQTIDDATMKAFENGTAFTVVKQAFKKGDAVTYQPLASVSTPGAAKKALKANKAATHVMVMPAGPVIPATALVGKNYTIKGTVANLQVRMSQRTQKPWASFGLKRQGKDTLSCVAFGSKIAEVVAVANKANGGEVKVFGYYKDQPNSDKQQFVILSVFQIGQ
jgi:hypothetical protein